VLENSSKRKRGRPQVVKPNATQIAAANEIRKSRHDDRKQYSEFFAVVDDGEMPRVEWADTKARAEMRESAGRTILKTQVEDSQKERSRARSGGRSSGKKPAHVGSGQATPLVNTPAQSSHQATQKVAHHQSNLLQFLKPAPDLDNSLANSHGRCAHRINTLRGTVPQSTLSPGAAKTNAGFGANRGSGRSADPTSFTV
jgi:hypothetical protein